MEAVEAGGGGAGAGVMVGVRVGGALTLFFFGRAVGVLLLVVVVLVVVVLVVVVEARGAVETEEACGFFFSDEAVVGREGGCDVCLEADFRVGTAVVGRFLADGRVEGCFLEAEEAGDGAVVVGVGSEAGLSWSAVDGGIFC